MSHYTVMVITSDGDYETALEPFDENLVVEPYIYKTKEEIIEQIKQMKKRYDEEIAKGGTDTWFEEHYGNVNWNDDESIYSAYRKLEEDVDFDENGNELSTYNPNSKWDWYSLGGRWTGTLKLKEGVKVIKSSEPSWAIGYEQPKEGYTDFAQVKDIDWTPDYTNLEHYKRFWEINVENSPLKENEKAEDFRSFYNANYYLKEYGTKENYIEDNCNIKTYAILNHGEWIEAGQMGWFGCSNATQDGYAVYRQVFKDIIKNLNPEDYVAIVDCYI